MQLRCILDFLNSGRISSNTYPRMVKWEMSRTLIILMWCLLLASSALGSSDASSLTAIENETVGKSSGSGIFRNAISNSGSNGNDVAGKDKSRLDNELHHTTFEFNGLDDDYPDEEDDSSYYDYDGDYSDSDSSYIDKEAKYDDEFYDVPRIAKCCNPGEALNTAGRCDKMSPKHSLNHDMEWFPKRVYDQHSEGMVNTNFSKWEIQVYHNLHCKIDERPEVVLNPRKYILLSDGSLFFHEDHRHLLPLEFCLDKQLGHHEGQALKACFSKQELCKNNQCIRKCCPKGAVATETNRSRCDISEFTHTHNFDNHSLNVIAAHPSCEYGFSLVEITSYNITSEGNLMTPEVNVSFLDYCLDYFSSMGRSGGFELPKLKVLTCFKSPRDGIDHQGLIFVPDWLSLILGIAMLISAVCLAVAAVISWRLPELRSLHGKCQLSHLATMFCLYLCLGIVQLSTATISKGLCTFLGVVIHICSLSSFLWLNLLCFNIYLTFRSLRPPLAARRDENRRLVLLCIYAWGIPAAFCMFLYILDSSQNDRLGLMPTPEYGKLRCLLSNREAEFAYLFGPVGVMLLINGILFCLTAQELLCGLWRLENSDSINFRRKSMGIVVAKLAIVMGMGWILDVISWALGSNSVSLFYATDIFNSLQGVFMSVILLWRKRVLEVLHIRKPSIAKDETLTARPFLQKNHSVNTVSNGDHDTSLVLVQDS